MWQAFFEATYDIKSKRFLIFQIHVPKFGIILYLGSFFWPSKNLLILGLMIKEAFLMYSSYNLIIFQIYLGIANGYPCFVISIAMIGLCTAVIGDVAGHLGCFIFLKDSVNAIAFVALGTSVPGTWYLKSRILEFWIIYIMYTLWAILN